MSYKGRTFYSWAKQVGRLALCFLWWWVSEKGTKLSCGTSLGRELVEQLEWIWIKLLTIESMREERERERELKREHETQNSLGTRETSFRKLGSTYSKPEIIKLAELTAHEDPIFNSISKKSDKETSWVWGLWSLIQCNKVNKATVCRPWETKQLEKDIIWRLHGHIEHNLVVGRCDVTDSELIWQKNNWRKLPKLNKIDKFQNTSMLSRPSSTS